MRAVDLCCGDGGVTRGMLAAGFDVTGFDIVCRPDYPAEATFGLHDVRELNAQAVENFAGGEVDWLHFSPPCQRFSLARAGRVKDPPTEADLDILKACLRLRDDLQPRFWTCENVRGAIPWFRPLLGEPVLRHGAFFLWGRFPSFLVEKAGLKKGIHGSKSPITKATGKQVKPKNPWASSVTPLELVRPLASAIAQEVAALG